MGTADCGPRGGRAAPLSASGPGGLRLVDVQGKLRLSKPTAHRLLDVAVCRRPVDQDETTKATALGTAARVLACPCRSDGPTSAAGVARAQRLAQRSGDTVFVMACDGLESVCVGRETGSFRSSAHGSRSHARPLGIGAGGLAVLGSMPPDDARRAIDTIAPKLAELSLSLPR